MALRATIDGKHMHVHVNERITLLLRSKSRSNDRMRKTPRSEPTLRNRRLGLVPRIYVRLLVWEVRRVTFGIFGLTVSCYVVLIGGSRGCMKT